MHHGSEGERGDETSQEVLNTHAQDGHTWGSENQVKSGKNIHTQTNTETLKIFFWKTILNFTLFPALRHFSL